MQEYEEDFFFEEDKILPKESKLACCKFSSSSRSAQGFQEKTDHVHSNLELSILVDINEEKNGKNVNENMSDATKKNQNSTTEAKDEVLSVEIQELSPECVINDLRQERYQLMYQNLLGMTVTSGNVTILKDDSNLIGISIGGGAPLCPCLYIVQVFDNTPAAKEGTLQSGDELVGVNGHSVKGKTKVEVAKMIQSAKEEVNINYNKLHADPQQGKSLDIVLKKVKHRIVENMSTSTADALGLSRAILCNDTLVKKLQELQNTEHMYKGLVEHAKRMLKAYFDLLQTYKNFGDVFSSIGVREPQPRASEAFSQFGAYHRQMEKDGIKMLKAVKPVLSDMGTYLNKAIPDTKLTIKKYADTKFEYLSYCLKVKEMDDEEYSYGALQEPLYRVETGNYEYRLILRCRQDARNRFARLRSDVLVKMELLDNKHVQDVVWQLQRFINGIAKFHEECLELSMANGKLFPVEVDLSQNAFQYKSTANFLQDEDDEESVQEIGNEVKEHYDVSTKRKDKKRHDQSSRTEGDNDPSSSTSLLSLSDEQTDSNVADSMSENTKLLAELGLSDTTTTPFDPNMMNSNSDLDMLNFSDGNNPGDFFNVDLMEKKTSPVADFKDMLKNGEDMSFTEFLSHTTCNSYSSGSGVKKESLDLITGLD